MSTKRPSKKKQAKIIEDETQKFISETLPFLKKKIMRSLKPVLLESFKCGVVAGARIAVKFVGI